MYFHLIWIKEKEWKQYELDLVLQWWDENFIRRFLANRWVVVVSVIEFKDNIKNFWNIAVAVTFENSEIWILTPWETLEDKAYFFISLWLSIHFINFNDNPVSDWKMQEIIKSTFSKIAEENEEIKRKKEEKEMKEKKKYSESAIEDTLKIINTEIDHAEQIIKAGNWIISAMDMKKLENLENELKKIRLWTNFNKMVSLILDEQELTKKLERDILAQNADKAFLIDKNSVTTNIDFIFELSRLNRTTEKAKIQPNGLTTYETFYSVLWLKAVFLRLLRKDLFNTLEQSSLDEFFATVMECVEYVVLIVTVTVSFLWLIEPLLWLWIDRFSLYLLPALWWLWLLTYLFNSLKLKWIIIKFVAFSVLAIIYWYGLVLLKGSFAL